MTYPIRIYSFVTNYYVLVYLALSLIAVLFNFVRTIIQYRGSLRASNRLFLGLLRSVCHAPIQFFEITPPGRILERFIKDIEIVDGSIGWQVGFLLQMAFSIIGAVFTIGIILPEFFIVSTVASKYDLFEKRVYSNSFFTVISHNLSLYRHNIY